MTQRPDDTAPVGVVGVGNMGLAMALRLRECGRRVVARDIRPEAPRRRPTAACWRGAAAW
jgi:3-hydroxyisobutyrate dehydrogenase-like beta-hydroxyacid dehydrogenase